MGVIIVIVSPEQLKTNIAPLLIVKLVKCHPGHIDRDQVLAQDGMVVQRIVVFLRPLL
jgi:hypothetical protein